MTIINEHEIIIEEDSSTGDNLAQEFPLVPTPNNIYYRTKLFSINSNINSLVNAASPLILLATKLRQLSLTPDSQSLYRNLSHEMKAFENKLLLTSYHSHIQLAACYIVATFIDEIISNTSWGKHNDWQYKKLLQQFSFDYPREDTFFLILERSCQEPAIHIDLLELIYICLSLGYEGKYRTIPSGNQQLMDITDNLYEIIQQQRGEFSKYLIFETELPKPTKQKIHLPPVLATIVTTLILLTGIYISFNYLLDESSSSLMQTLEQLKNQS